MAGTQSPWQRGESRSPDSIFAREITHDMKPSTLLRKRKDESLALGKLKREITEEVLRGDPAGKSTDEALIRFLRAREGSVRDAKAMYDKWRAWRAEFQVDGVTADQIPYELSTGKCRWIGSDRVGRPTLLMLPRLHEPKVSVPKQVIRFAIFLLEEGSRKADESSTDQVNPNRHIAVIYDRTGMKMRNVDYKLFGLFKQLVGLAQDFYAERLGALYIVGANWFYWALYKVVSPFLTKRTLDKIFILGSHAELLEHFSLDALAAGGNAEYAELVRADEQLRAAQESAPKPAPDSVSELSSPPPSSPSSPLQTGARGASKARARRAGLPISFTGGRLAAADEDAVAERERGDARRLAQEAARALEAGLGDPADVMASVDDAELALACLRHADRLRDARIQVAASPRARRTQRRRTQRLNAKFKASLQAMSPKRALLRAQAAIRERTAGLGSKTLGGAAVNGGPAAERKQ
jgi:hypothetical protein